MGQAAGASGQAQHSARWDLTMGFVEWIIHEPHSAVLARPAARIIARTPRRSCGRASICSTQPRGLGRPRTGIRV